MTDSYDIVFIGGGPGGYNGAIRAAQLGFKTACIEKRGSLGGTCLNVGCIPSKALLHASELYEETANGIAKMGVVVDGVSLDLPAMMAHKEQSVDQLTKGIEFLFKKNKVDYIAGLGHLTGPGKITVDLRNGQAQDISAAHIVISTGSEVMNLPGVTIDEETVVSSTGALALKTGASADGGLSAAAISVLKWAPFGGA